MKNLFLLIIALTFFATSCEKDKELCTKKIKVTVVDDFTGNPIEGAEITDLRSNIRAGSSWYDNGIGTDFPDGVTDQEGQYLVGAEGEVVFWTFRVKKDQYSMMDDNAFINAQHEDCGSLEYTAKLIPLAYLDLKTEDDPQLNLTGFSYDSHMVIKDSDGWLKDGETVLVPIPGGRESTIKIRSQNVTTEVPIFALPGETISHTVKL